MAQCRMAKQEGDEEEKDKEDNKVCNIVILFSIPYPASFLNVKPCFTAI